MNPMKIGASDEAMESVNEKTVPIRPDTKRPERDVSKSEMSADMVRTIELGYVDEIFIAI